jgi:hypothetical protein
MSTAPRFQIDVDIYRYQGYTLFDWHKEKTRYIGAGETEFQRTTLRDIVGKQLLPFALVGIVLTVASGLAYVFARTFDAKNHTSLVFEELFKAGLNG